MYLRNSRGHTPLILAALQGDHDVFAHVLRQSSAVIWKFGPMVCLTTPLEQIDTLNTDELLPSSAPRELKDGMRFHGVIECVLDGQVESLSTNSVLVSLQVALGV